jgi:peroxiredoxin
VARTVTVVVALLLAGLAAAVTALVLTRPGLPGSAEAPGDEAAAAVPRRSPPGYRPSVAEAMRELELVKPPQPRAAGDFTLPTPDGGRFRLSEHRGRVVFINFWATWCPPCRQEMPSLERLYAGRKDRGFSMVAVALDAGREAVAPYLARGGFTFPVALDPGMDLASAYGVRALPASFIVDPRGVVVAQALGARDWDAPAAHALMDGVAR